MPAAIVLSVGTYKMCIRDRLRAFDKSGVDVILAAALKEDGVGLAVMNRMFKSAGYNIREVE